MSEIIKENSVVSMHYVLRDAQGNILDSSQPVNEQGEVQPSDEAQPLTYLQGHGQIIPGLEQALVGKNVGDHVQVTVEAEQAYGERSEELVQTVERALFGDATDIEVGMTFRASDDTGTERHVVVSDVDEQQVTVDANHPLAGMALNFDVQVQEVREATAEEIDHGHAHN